MFHFSTGIKSISTFNPTIELEEANGNYYAPASSPFPTQTTRYPAKQSYLYNQAIATATKLKGIWKPF